MEFNNTALRAELGNTLRAFDLSLEILAVRLRRQTATAWAWVEATGNHLGLSSPSPDLPVHVAIEKLTEAILEVEYKDGQDAHTSRIAPGVLMVDRQVAEQAEDVNRQKQRLAAVLLQMQGRTEPKQNPITLLEELRPLREVALEGFGRRRLHHNQATRELVVIPTVPDYVGFTWTQMREVRRTSKEKVLEDFGRSMQNRLITAVEEQDLSALRALPDGEPLAHMRPARLTPRVNLAWEAAAGQKEVRTSKVAVMPLLICGARLPDRFRRLPPAPPPPNYRLARSDVQLQQNPLLQTLPIYQYLPQFREAKRRLLRTPAPGIPDSGEISDSIPEP